ncbi:MAG: VRR-NUC domain-containing protein [Pseudomonadota bacterium]
MTLTLDKHGKLKISEAQLQRDCMKLLRLCGWYVRPAPKESYKAGIPTGEPDLLAVRPGRGLWLELKTPDGKVSDVQRDWHKWARGRGDEIHVIRSIDELRELIGVSGRKG